jgi:hypothetical protein
MRYGFCEKLPCLDMHFMHIWDLPGYDLCVKMAPKCKITGRNTIAQEKESSTPDYGTMQHSIPEVDRGCVPEQEMALESPTEVTVEQAFNKMA